MTDVSRRQFLRHAGIGAAATGAVALGGVTLFESLTSASATSLASDASPATPHLEGSDIFAHIEDARTGQMTIFFGSKAVPYTNKDLAQLLLQAAQ